MKQKNLFFISLTLLIIIMVCPVASAENSINLETGLSYLINARTSSAGNPFIPFYGISYPIHFSSLFYLKPGINLTGTEYRYLDEVPVPASYENREYWVLISNIDCAAGFNFTLSESLKIGLETGFSFVLWYPFSLFPESNMANELIHYFYNTIGFVYPLAALNVEWKTSQSFGVIFSIKGLYPIVYKITHPAVPVYDQLIIQAGIGFSFYF